MKALPVAWPAPPQPVKEKPIWVVSLIDTFSLLLCFFILIFSMGSPDTRRFREIAGSLAKQLPVQGTRPLAPPAPPSREAPTLATDVALNLDYLTSLVEGRIERLPGLAGLELQRRSDRLVLMPPSDVAFAGSAAALLPGAAPMLAAIGDLLAHVPNRLEVRGAVGQGVTWELALARASAVARAVRDGGYSSDPVVVAGTGGSAVELSLLPTSGDRR
jgi:flagellar motor protein MotB